MTPARLPILGLDLDGSLASYPTLRERLDALIDLRTMADELRLWSWAAAARRLEERLRPAFDEFPGPRLILLGSGDFHHLSLILLRSLAAEPEFDLVLIDNHPDWCVLPPALHCGNWLSRAARLPNVRRTWLMGQTSADVGWLGTRLGPGRELKSGRVRLIPTERDAATAFDRVARELRGRRVYLSVDKDSLRSRDAITDWDQGSLSLKELRDGISILRDGCEIIGSDLCGERGATPLRGVLKRIDARRFGRFQPLARPHTDLNEAATMAIIEAFDRPHTPAQEGPATEALSP